MANPTKVSGREPMLPCIMHLTGCIQFRTFLNHSSSPKQILSIPQFLLANQIFTSSFFFNFLPPNQIFYILQSIYTLKSLKPAVLLVHFIGIHSFLNLKVSLNGTPHLFLTQVQMQVSCFGIFFLTW